MGREVWEIVAVKTGWRLESMVRWSTAKSKEMREPARYDKLVCYIWSNGDDTSSKW